MFLYRILTAIFIVAFSIKSVELTAQNNLKNTTSPMPLKLIQPPHLKAGDTVAIIAPSGVLMNDDNSIQLGAALLKSWKLNVVWGKHLLKRNGHFAGTDEERAADFQWALDDPKIKAIWCARGGYGSVRVLDKLDYTKFKVKPKWIIGYSDITAFHNQLHNEGYQSIHALMCTTLKNEPEKIKETIASFKNVIFGKSTAYTVPGSQYNKTGKTSGPLVGGNLTLLHTMLGSVTSINMKGKILFIEEIGEYAYHIDRMLQSLKRAGYFEGCKGLIVGDISRVRKNTTAFGRTIEEIVLDVVADYDFPVLFNFPAGHEDDNRALILGKTVELNVGKTSSELKFMR